MTDEELLTRLAETPVEEWTPDELELLRARLPESPDLRAALAEHLMLETALTAGLGRSGVSADKILSRVDAEARAKFAGRAVRWAAVLLIAFSIGGGLWYYRSLHQPDEPIAKNDGKKPALWPEEDPPPAPSATASGTAPPPVPTATASGTAATAVVTPPQPPPNADATEPWVAMLAKAPRPFDELAFDDRRQTRDPTALGRWWDTVGGSQQLANKGQEGLELAGLFKLRAPWPKDALLTLYLNEWGNDSVRIHLWNGDRGVTIEHLLSPHDHWSAYIATKRTDRPAPASLAYAAGDDERGRRTGRGPIDLAWHDGRVYVSRGDVCLLSAPLAELPDAVYLDGRTKVKGMALAHSTGVPPEWVAAPPKTWSDFTSDTPVFSSPGDEVKFERVGAAGLKLAAPSNDKEAWVALPITRPGFHEIYFDLVSADLFTGIYLGDAEGKPKHAVGVYPSSQLETPTLAFGDPNSGNGRGRTDKKKAGDAAVGFPVKVRLFVGCNYVKCDASIDGVCWGRVADLHRADDAKVATVGVYAAKQKSSRSIEVSNISFRTVLSYDDSLAGELPPPPKNYDYTPWVLHLLRGDESSEVRFHRLAKALCSGIPADAERLVLAELATLPCGDSPADVPKTVERDLEYVGRLGRLNDVFEPAIADRWTERIIRSPAIVATRHDAEENDVAVHSPFSAVRKALIGFMTGGDRSAVTMPDEPIRNEIVRLMLDGDWDRLERACRAWHRFGGREELGADGRRVYTGLSRPIAVSLVDWAAAQAERRRDGDATNVVGTLNPLRAEWRHPLMEQFGKEGYNVLAELETALEEKAYEDACRIITGVTASQAVGLLPNAHDKELLTSLPGAVVLAMKLHPELRTTMQREYGDLAMLRLKQATTDGDLDAVRALTTQFFGTVAAAQAQLWLGDRALAMGDAPRAEGHYRAAAREGSPDEADTIAARLRLAAAFQGRDYGAPPTSGVRLGETTVSPTEFERIVSTLRGRAAAPSASSASAAPRYLPEVVEALPPAATYRLKPFAVLDGDAGKSGEPPKKEFDYVAAQTTVAESDGRLIVSNRFHVAAYNLSDGKRVWRNGLSREQGGTFQWPGVPMPPVVVENRIFVRRLLSNGPELACLEADDGNVVWRSPRGDVVASDPVVRGDRVSAVTLTVPQSEALELAISTYDVASGRLLGRRPIAVVRDYWKKSLPCFLTMAEDMLVVSAAGCVIGCDGEGEPRWTRRLLWAPPTVDPLFGPASWTAPVVGDNRVEVAQPGVPFRYIIDVRTGSLIEQRTEIRNDRPAPSTVIVGSPLLESPTAVLSGPNVETIGRKLYRSRLVWSEHDRVVAHAALGPWLKQYPGYGPVVRQGDRLFAFTADDIKKSTRQIVELVAEGEPQAADVARDPSPALADWRRSALGAGQWEMSRLARDWTLMQNRYQSYVDKIFTENKTFLEQDCVVTNPSGDRHVFWTRDVTVPAGTGAKLQLRTAAAGEAPYRLGVRVGEETVFERVYDPVKSGSPWHDDEVDLVKYAGKPIRLVLVAENAMEKQTKTALVAWQRMEVVAP